jgi:hypothetical protein
MTNTLPATERTLKPPRAAALAGSLFAILMAIGLGVVRVAVPVDPGEPSSWLTDSVRRNAVQLALNLVPFAGIAFLWFIGVLRNRLGRREDQFFATVLLSSGLLFVVSVFISAATARALMETLGAGKIQLPNSEVYYFARRMTYALLNIFGIKMAGVFMFSTCAIALRTGIFPRWIAFTGFGCGLVLLLVITSWEWIALLFPAWMLLLSVQILVADLRHGSETQPD